MSIHKYPISEQRSKELENIYTYHAPKDDQQARYVYLREVGKTLAAAIELSCPPSREKSVAMTHLETALFWANASIARNE